VSRVSLVLHPSRGEEYITMADVVAWVSEWEQVADTENPHLAIHANTDATTGRVFRLSADVTT